MTTPSFRVPSSTYRIQCSGRFRFGDARATVPYLDRLGITDLYLSPVLRARRGSSHGYDVTDPTRLNPELGTESEFDALASELAGAGMGLLLDIVPNHMAASDENPWWSDLLESGADSPFAGFFDVDWRSPKKALERKVLLPILGGPYGRALENQELRLVLDPGGFFVRYYGTKLPVAVRSYPRILSHRLETLEETYGAEHPPFRELLDLVTAIEHLAPPGAPGGGAEARYRDEEAVKRRLADLVARRAEIRTFLEGNVRIFNGRRNDPGSFVHLDRLLAEQHWWLSYWRLANEEINYRRFFAISDLVSVRVEDPRVFEASHALVLRLAREGKATGFRVDHIDGLYDPLGYLHQLRQGLFPEGGGPGGQPPGFYLLVEKILAEDEALPPEWPVSGTTGYDFLNAASGVFVSARGARALAGVYARFLGRDPSFEDLVYERKKLILETLFAGEMHTLGQHLGRLAEEDRYARDLPRKELRQAIVEVTAWLPVYRTYIRGTDLSARDRLYLGRALKEAARRSTEASAPVFDFLRRVLLLESPPFASGGQQEEWLRFLMRWQQFTGPIMAKGFEDTVLYVYHPLLSLNEVGGNPAGTGGSAKAFHDREATVAQRWPHTMNATSTHDTKRCEDVRARIHVLSEIPEEWEGRLRQWSEWNEGKKRTVRGLRVPDRNEEIHLYQTLLGAWPLDSREREGFPARIREYMVKAAREAKVHTRWIRPHPDHEGALTAFSDAILADAEENRFLRDFLPFQQKVAHFGAINSLAQLLLKVASPGVPDFYQGTELWSLRVVDPDNRCPVDFRAREELLRELERREERDPDRLRAELLPRWEDGRLKLYLTWKALRFRRRRRELFRDGSYLPLAVSGGKKDHVLAFARTGGEEAALAAVPRLCTRLVPPGEFPLGQKAWGSAGALLLPEGLPERWRNVLTGEVLHAAAGDREMRLPLHGIFRVFPVALLESLP